MTNKIKNTQIKILTINNKTYLPYQLHQLPKFFDKYTTDFFNLKGYCYINLNDHSDSFDLTNFKNRLTFHKNLSGSLSR